MTEPFEVRRDGPFQGTGSGKVFAITFPFDLATEIMVVRWNQTTVLPTKLADPADYTVQLAPTSTVTLVLDLAATEELVIFGRSAVSQLLDILLGELTASAVTEKALDFLTRLVQEQLELSGRALVADETVAGTLHKDGAVPAGVRITGLEALVATDVVKFTVTQASPMVWAATKA